MQLSSINALYITDINADKMPDILFGGNEYGFLPQFERLDAGRGGLLLNKGKANFSLMGSEESGIDLEGQIRDVQEIKGGKTPQYLFLRNEKQPVLFQLHTKGNVKN